MSKRLVVVVGMIVLVAVPTLFLLASRSQAQEETPQITHGPISGEVTDSSAVVWARGNISGTLTFEVAETDDFADPIAITTEVGLENDFTGEALVEGVEIRTLESSPVQVQAVLSGQLPDACAFVESTNVTVEGDTFYISMTVARQPNMRCAQMLTPFEQIVPLATAGLAAGQYTVQAGEATATFVLQ